MAHICTDVVPLVRRVREFVQFGQELETTATKSILTALWWSLAVGR